MKEGGTIRGPAPKGWLRMLLRLPVFLYRARMGWLFGQRFLLLTHVGRKSGLRHHTVLEVVRYERSCRTCFVASGWGEKAQWFKNIIAQPEVEVTLGARTRRAWARRIERGEAEQALRDYARRHPWAVTQLARIMLGRGHEGSDEDFELLAEHVPLVELRLGDGAP
jgi:deazaflavin-dependent oxidoreductase (nitroreductase family)